MNLSHSVALVTGANRGLGRAFAQGLIDAGAHKVYAAVRRPGTAPSGTHEVVLDVNDVKAVAQAASQCTDVNLLVNNAGILRPGSLLAPRSLDDLREQLDTHLYGPLALAQAFAPSLKAHGGGAIVNILSVLSWISLPMTGSYSTSKAAAWAATNALRQELAAQGTQVLAVHAAYIDTDMASRIDGPKTDPAEVVRLTLAALQSGEVELLVDDTSRQVKAGLSATKASYLGLAAAA